MTRARPIPFFVAASCFLFIFQALRVAISVLFGIIYDQVFEGPVTGWLGVSNLLVLLALLAPAFAPRRPRPGGTITLVVLVAAARVALTVRAPEVRYWGSLVVLAAGGMYLVALLSLERLFALQVVLAGLAADQILRVVGHTYDVTLRPGWLVGQAVWAVALIGWASWSGRRQGGEEARERGSIGLSGGLAFGGWLFLESSLYSLPNAVARWSGWSYPVLAPLLFGLTFTPLLPPMAAFLRGRSFQRRGFRLGLTALTAMLSLAGYFGSGVLAAVALLFARVAALGSLACLLLGVEKGTERPGVGVGLGMGLVLVLNYFNAFAFTYPYTLPFMRGLGWVVYLAAVIVMGFGVIGARESPAGRVETAKGGSLPWAALALGLAVSVVAVWPRPAAALPVEGVVRIATYNIHYGYDETWRFTLDAQARAMEAEGVDVAALQEVDTGRLTSYGVDDAYYLARQLRMNVAYLPTVEHLTGIALLYRGPAALTDSRLLASLQEQTGIVHVHLSPGGQVLSLL